MPARDLDASGAPVLHVDDLLRAAAATADARREGAPGRFARAPGGAADPYGCADAANILYTLGLFPRGAAERAGFVDALRAFQDPDTGLFHEATHDPIHTTAHCIAALELFDAGPAHPLSALAPLRDPGALPPYLDTLAWRASPWTEAHKGAGLFAALTLAGEVGADWQERYFAWLWEASDPDTGLFRRGHLPALPAEERALFPHLAGTFHYLFNLEAARRPLRHPEALVDTCLAIRARSLFPLCAFVGFAEIDWVYCLSRSLRQTAHRFDEARAALRDFAAAYVAFLRALDRETDEGWNDLHRLFGALCALAELQQALPGLVRSERPLRLVLDRRPFI